MKKILSEQTVQISVKRYRDSSGLPTCVKKLPGKKCIFYRVSYFGSKEICGYLGAELFRRVTSDLDLPFGTRIPDAKCPLWQDEVGHENNG